VLFTIKVVDKINREKMYGVCYVSIRSRFLTMRSLSTIYCILSKAMLHVKCICLINEVVKSVPADVQCLHFEDTIFIQHNALG
jgi:hypothetical protein